MEDLLPLLTPLILDEPHDYVHIEHRGFDMIEVKWYLHFKYMVAISDRSEQLNRLYL